MLIVEMDGWSHDCMSRKGSVLITLLCVTSMFGCYFQSRAWLLEMDMKGEGRNNDLICTVGWFSSFLRSNFFSYSSQTSGYNIQYPWGWYDCFIFNPWPTKKDLLFRLGLVFVLRTTLTEVNSFFTVIITQLDQLTWIQQSVPQQSNPVRRERKRWNFFMGNMHLK